MKSPYRYDKLWCRACAHEFIGAILCFVLGMVALSTGSTPTAHWFGIGFLALEVIFGVLFLIRMNKDHRKQWVEDRRGD